jgi:hypothetical protein
MKIEEILKSKDIETYNKLISRYNYKECMKRKCKVCKNKKECFKNERNNSVK